MNSKSATVIGAGLAGCEAAWQMANRGIKVTLIEMKPNKLTPAHHSSTFAELVCSNSFRAERVENAVGLLKEEMRELNSIIMRAADETRLPAGGALAVDREGFSALVTKLITEHENITIINEETDQIPDNCIVATGPLTSDIMAKSIIELFGSQGLYFFDAAAPIVTLESMDMDKIYRASRYGKGSDDYLNCPMDKDQYFAFVRELVNAKTAEVADFESKKIFEGCMPVEVMASRGEMTLAFGPLKPVGLEDPKTGKTPFAVAQLRQDNAQGTLFNIVGFQTHLCFSEQKRVFSMLPGLENAEFVRYGVMHRNTFIKSPGKLSANYEVLGKPGVFFAGQMTGVEGYIESASSGLIAGLALSSNLMQNKQPNFCSFTAMGALGNYISSYNGGDFQPMNINFGIIDSLDKKVKSKQERYAQIANRSLDYIKGMNI